MVSGADRNSIAVQALSTFSVRSPSRTLRVRIRQGRCIGHRQAPGTGGIGGYRNWAACVRTSRVPASANAGRPLFEEIDRRRRNLQAAQVAWSGRNRPPGSRPGKDCAQRNRWRQNPVPCFRPKVSRPERQNQHESRDCRAVQDGIAERQGGPDSLRQAGFPKVRNLTGGIHAWSDQVDPSVREY